MTVVETRFSVWEALAGRAPGHPAGPADPGLWAAVVERLNPARARPRLRPGIEEVHLTSVRDVPYVMLRSPDGMSPRPPATPNRATACYLRLTPEEATLAGLMDGTRTVARLVAEFARICGRLAPDQVTRVVADLAGNRMLDELPVDVFRPLDRMHRRPWPARLWRGLLAAAKGQRMVVADADRVVGFLYRAGGRALFTRPAAVGLAVVALAGFAAFCWTWWRGDQSVFLTGGSYATGAAVLLGLNVLALACHELGHALATKHAGRRVPAAGFLVYFGIPSVFVDTTDVWMAGRRSRILATAAGPGAGIALAGAAQLVGLVFPALAPWTFKLSFAWYLNALFNLNPFLALDGYYLLMDWLELPNLRARGMAWVVARLRRCPPRWAELDREGRLVALYGVLAVLWLAIAANLAYRIYSDRVSGLVTGLWRAGAVGRLLLLAVVAGLAAPVVYALVGWLTKRARRLWREWLERRVAADAPRRLAALHLSALARLPAEVLTRLAEEARWVRPRTGEQLVFAGATQSTVYVVVDGGLEARRPGDPSGMVRERVGAGGVVGLANAITGAPSSLAWHTVGTTLLSVPGTTVAATVDKLPGPMPSERAEAEELFEDTPALSELSTEDKLGLMARSRPVHLPPGTPVELTGPADAVVIASGIVELPDGSPLRRGTMIGPAGEELTRPVATTRSPVRLWHLPAVSGLPLLLGFGGSLGPGGPAGPGQAPVFGAHPPAAYPPLAAPPGPPPSHVDDSADRRFERIMWWLVAIFLLIALLLTGSNLLPGPAWAEMPADRALLSAERGRVIAVVDGELLELAKGDQVYVSERDEVRVSSKSRGRLTFRGGSAALLCGGSETRVGPLWSASVRPVRPAGELDLVRGRLLADTASTSGAFAPLRLRVGDAGRTIVNDGKAWYAVDPGSVTVSTGVVRADGGLVPMSGTALSCGDGETIAPPAGSPSPSGPPGLVPPASSSPSPSPTPSRTPSATATSAAPGTPTPTASARAPESTPTTPGSSPTRSPSPSQSSPPPPPRDTEKPAVTVTDVRSSTIAQQNDGAACQSESPLTTTIVATITDNAGVAGVDASYLVEADGSGGGLSISQQGDTFYFGLGPIDSAPSREQGGTVTVTISASDAAENVGRATQVITLDPCRIGGQGTASPDRSSGALLVLP